VIDHSSISMSPLGIRAQPPQQQSKTDSIRNRPLCRLQAGRTAGKKPISELRDGNIAEPPHPCWCNSLIPKMPAIVLPLTGKLIGMQYS